MSKITRLTFYFGTNQCVSGISLLMDEANLQTERRVEKLRTCVRVKGCQPKLIASATIERLRVQAKGEGDEGLNLCSRRWRKYTTALMTFVNIEWHNCNPVLGRFVSVRVSYKQMNSISYKVPLARCYNFAQLSLRNTFVLSCIKKSKVSL